MNRFIASWLDAAVEILGTEFARSVNLLPGAVIPDGVASFTLMVDLAGDWEGTFTVSVDLGALAGLIEQCLPVDRAGGEGAAKLTSEDTREQWQPLFRRICIQAAASLGKQSGMACEVAMISPEEVPVGGEGMGYQLLAGSSMAALLIADRVASGATAAAQPPVPARSEAGIRPDSIPALPYAGAQAGGEEAAARAATEAIAERGIDLLLDVELEASLRFGSREMALSDLLALGPGDVIQLDRALSDPVDLIIGDKIVARGEVVLVNGNFGLQVTEVAEPRKSLESIRCLF